MQAGAEHIKSKLDETGKPCWLKQCAETVTVRRVVSHTVGGCNQLLGEEISILNWKFEASEADV